MAAETGWPLEKVQRYSSPPLAEREYVAGRAQLVEVRRTGGSVTLGDTVAAALKTDGAAEIQWDAARRADAKWVVIVTFTSRSITQQASWTYDNIGRTVHPLDETARHLMGISDEQIFDYITEVPIAIVTEPAAERPHLVAVPDVPVPELVEIQELEDNDPAQEMQTHFIDVLIPINDPVANPAAKPAPKPKAKGKRASVPSWDEILFGATRGDDV